MRWHWGRRGTTASVVCVNTTSATRKPDSGYSTQAEKPALLCNAKPIVTISALEQRAATARASASSTAEHSRVTAGSPFEQLQQFGARFQSVEYLQDGGTGIAYRALDTTSNRVVVLKTYNARRRQEIAALSSASEPDNDTTEQTCRLDTELQYLSLCASRSPNIIALLGAFKHPDLPARTTMVLEYAELGDLFEFSKAAWRAARLGCDAYDKPGTIRGLPETLHWHWTAQMSSALAFLHHDLGEGRTIIHSDVKLENWLVCAPSQPSLLYGEHSIPSTHHRAVAGNAIPADVLPRWAYPDVKLADFDLARFAHDAPRAHPHFSWGTPAAQPPEYPRDSKPGDVWGVGACLHHLVTGGYPIEPPPPQWHGMEEGRDRYELRADRRVEDVKAWGASRHMDEMLRGCICAKSGQRIGGLLNMEPRLRWTALEAKVFSERMIQSHFWGKARQFPLRKSMYWGSQRSGFDKAHLDVELVEDLDTIKL